jgi:hypothetical protein
VTPKVVCFLCGKDVEPKPPDICVVTLTTRWQESGVNERDIPSQDLYCHAVCLKKILPANQPSILDVDDGSEEL